MKKFSPLVYCCVAFLLMEKVYAKNHDNNSGLTKIVLENLHHIQKDMYGNRISIKTSSLSCFAASDVSYGTCHVKGEFPDAGGPNGAQFAIAVGMNDEGAHWFKVLDIASWD